MTYRKGDIVHVLAEVRSDFDPAVESHVELAFRQDWCSVRAELLTLVSRQYKVGDVVRSKHDQAHPNTRYEVLAADGDQIWIKRTDTGRRVTLNAKDVELATPPIPGHNENWWVEPPPPPQDEPAPNTAETFEGGIRVTPKLFGVVPQVRPNGGDGDEIEYTTAPGDTLQAMAYVFGTSVDTIKVMNPSPSLMDAAGDAPLELGLTLRVLDNRMPF